MQAHLVQLDIAWEDKAANYGKVRTLLRSVPIRPGDLIVLPEMFDTGFSLADPNATADGDWPPALPDLPPKTDAATRQSDPKPRSGATACFLQSLASEHQVTVHGSRTLVDGQGKGRNMATIVGPSGRLLAEYAKVHPFSYGKETERFVGGSEVLTYPWTHAGADPVTICPAVCYDLRFPELFRQGLRKGAEMYVIGANWPAVRAFHWRTLLIARAIENQAIVIGVNRAGSDPALAYGGGSVVVGPKGDILGELDAREAVLTVDIDPQSIREWRKTFPAWRDAKLLGP